MSKNILIVGPAWVGDMVMAQSLFMALKQRDASTQISVLAPAWTNPLLARMPEVARSIAMPVGHGKLGLAARWRLARQLKTHDYTQAIVLPNSLKAALVPFMAGIKKRTGFVGEQRYGLLNDLRRLDKQALPLNVQRFVALASDKGKPVAAFINPALQLDQATQALALSRLKLSHNRSILALCPGAEYGPAKQWPAKHFAALAKQYFAKGGMVWIFGSEKDRAVADQINQLSGGVCQVLAGETSLGEVVDLMACVDAVVSNDSGLMHIAAALDKKLVALYGSSSPNFTPPLSNKASVLHTDIDCRPCFKRVCPLGHTNCLQQLTVERVLEKISAL